MTAMPVLIPLTRPVLLAVAVAGALLVHVTVRPVSVPPAAFFRVTDICFVAPTATLALAGLSVTEATGAAVTVIAALPLAPPLVAVIVALPAATPETRPAADTVATAVLLDVHVNDGPLIAVPDESAAVAVSCDVRPVPTLAVAGVTVTAATVAGGGLVSGPVATVRLSTHMY